MLTGSVAIIEGDEFVTIIRQNYLVNRNACSIQVVVGEDFKIHFVIALSGSIFIKEEVQEKIAVIQLATRFNRRVIAVSQCGMLCRRFIKEDMSRAVFGLWQRIVIFVSHIGRMRGSTVVVVTGIRRIRPFEGGDIAQEYILNQFVRVIFIGFCRPDG